MFKGEIYISKDYKLEDYLRLKLRIDSDEDIWKSAMNIFISRMKGRYFDAIDKLSEEINKYGFSIMVLECLIIDTLVKFRYGPNKTETGRYLTDIVIDKKNESFQKFRYYQENKVRFRKFLEEFFIFEDNKNKKYISKKFYEDIRSSIVHFGSTENTSRLTCDSSRLFTILENRDISVDITIMNNELKRYFNKYIEELKDKNNTELRKNFMLAMNYLCGVYENFEVK